MAFDAAYTLSQSSPSTITLTDTSTGADATITARKIYLYQYNSNTIVPSNNPTGQVWIDWAIADTEITLTDIFDTDVCLNIYVVWVTATPDSGSTYTVNQAYCFKDYNEEFMEALTSEKAVAQPNIVNSTNFIYSWMQLRLYVDAAYQIVNDASDVTNGQQLINEANKLRDKQSFYY